MSHKNAYSNFMITEREFGRLQNGEIVIAYDFTTETGFRATVLSYGATLQSLIFPDGIDVVLGFDGLEGYLDEHPYFGAAIGRVANRISGAQFEIDGERFNIPVNEGRNNLHSGPEGFDRINWAGEIRGETLILRHTSPNKHQGFPGELKAELQLQFDGNTLSMNMKAATNAPTPVNLTYHPYFNLTDGGRTPCTDHMLEIKAEYCMEKDAQHLPTGQLTPCAYQTARPISDRETKNLDHNFVRSLQPQSGMFKHAKLWSERTGHKVIICSTQPCLQVYTGGFIPELKGKGGMTYGPNHGVALEPQGYIDSLNHAAFPDITLRPGETYAHKISYTFRLGEAQV